MGAAVVSERLSQTSKAAESRPTFRLLLSRESNQAVKTVRWINQASQQINQLVVVFKYQRCGSAQRPVQLLTRFKRPCELQLSWTVDVSRSGLGGSCDRKTRRIPGFSLRNRSSLLSLRSLDAAAAAAPADNP